MGQSLSMCGLNPRRKCQGGRGTPGEGPRAAGIVSGPRSTPKKIVDRERTQHLNFTLRLTAGRPAGNFVCLLV